MTRKGVLFLSILVLFCMLSLADGQVPNTIHTLGATEFAIKQADQSKTSDTTLANDTELFVIMDKNTTYVIRGQIFINTASGAPDVQLQFTGPAAVDVRIYAQIYDTAGDTILGPFSQIFTALATVLAPNWGGAATSQMQFYGTITNSTTTDYLRVQWAQRVSSVDATTVKRGSWISVTRK